MQCYKISKPVLKALVICYFIPILSHANQERIAPQDHSVEAYSKLAETITPLDETKLSTELPSENTDSKESKQESINYLKSHPKEFEDLLSILLIQGNAQSLKELLPIYQEIPNYDPSVIDWGNAIITSKEGNLDEGIKLYRKLNAKLPEVNIIRFQMAITLFYNRQFEAAESEFEKLRSETSNEADIKVINSYLEAINEQDSWDFYASLSYLDDSNITNSPKQGTELKGDNGSSLVYTSPREEGKGLNFYARGDKKWSFENKAFTALHLNTRGKYYWDNKNFNDITVGIGTGIGYQNNVTEVELGPFYDHRWYGKGLNGDGDLHDYADTIGLKLNLNQWINDKLRYQGLMRYGNTSYIEDYKHNDGKDFLIANTAIYLPDGQQFWVLGLDYAKKDSEVDSNSFDRTGLRLGWGQTWPKGYSTKFDVGYAQRNYDSEDFFGIKRENEEYSAGVSFWKRDFTVFGLTPRLELDYYKVESNSPFEEYDKSNVSVELTKAF